MRCGEFEARLEAWLCAELETAEAAACERHLSRCPACSELAGLARIAERGESPPPADLLGRVLAETSGSGCAAARRRLCTFVDGELDAGGAALVAGHLAGCADCRGLAGALEALAVDLPTLAELSPGPGFVRSVLARTLPVHVRLARWWRRSWPRWVLRPRFAVEAAYAATLVLVLVFATPGSPLEAMPRRAVALARAPVAAADASPWVRLERAVAPRWRRLTESEAAGAVIGGVGGTLRTGAELARRAREVAESAPDWAGERLRTFHERFASLLESAGEDASPAPIEPDSDPDKETS